MRPYLVTLILASASPAWAGSSPGQSVLRLGNLGHQSIVLPCLTAAESNQRAASEGSQRPYGWQFHHPGFSCKATPAQLPGMVGECTPLTADADFIDFFFASDAACQAFADRIAFACERRPSSLCLEFLEGYFSGPDHGSAI